MTTRILAAAVLVAVVGCRPSPRPVDEGAMSAPTGAAPAGTVATSTPTPTPTPTSTPTSTSTSTAAAIPTAPPPAPALAPVRSAVAIEPAARTVLSSTAETVIDPAATFEVELASRVSDARIALVDVAEAHVAAKDVREVAGTTRLTLAPETPLAPGSRYLLRIDGAAVREMHDAEGRAFAPIGFPVLVAGTPPPPPPKATPKKKRRR